MGRRIRAQRPSPAIIVAVLALVGTLAGTAVAGPDASTSAINKKKVKKIAKKQAVKQINKLAPGLSVASADIADTANTANSATSAGSVDGLSAARIDYRIPSGPSAERTILDIGGLILRARCGGSGNVDVEADTRVAGAVISVAVSKENGGTDIARAFHDDNFNPGDDDEFLEEGATQNFDIQGTLTYSTAAGSHVTATFQSDEVPFGPNSCLFAGTALHTPS